MPIPKPNKDETQKDFISRCMGNPIMDKEFPDKEQRSAVCYTAWREKKMSEETLSKSFGGALEEIEQELERGQGQGVGGPRQGDGGADTCVCPKCGATAPHQRGVPCVEQKCPKCGSSMVGQ